VTFSATDGSSTITVTDTAHGALASDFVIISGATGLGGNITADVLNQEYQIDERIDGDTYTITAREAGTTIPAITVDGQLDPDPIIANASDTGDGGTETVGEYLLNRTLDTTILGVGWGAGPWSRGTWSSDAENPAVSSQIALWSHDLFGEDLLINQRGGGVYYPDHGVGPRSPRHCFWCRAAGWIGIRSDAHPVLGPRRSGQLDGDGDQYSWGLDPWFGVRDHSSG